LADAVTDMLDHFKPRFPETARYQKVIIIQLIDLLQENHQFNYTMIMQMSPKPEQWYLSACIKAELPY
jgi:hypothetical protein